MNENERNYNGLPSEYYTNQAQYNQPQANYGQPQMNYNQPQPPKKKKGNGGLVAGILCGALVLGGIGGFGGAAIGYFMAPSVSIPVESTSTPQTGDSSESDKNDNVTRPESGVDFQQSATPQSIIDEAKINDKTNSTLLTKEELYEKIKHTVVLLYNYKSIPGSDEPVLAGSASGVVFTADGYIVTNAHVVEGAAKMTVVVPDYENEDETSEYEAEILGSDSATDLAVIKITRDEPFEYALLGDSDNLKVGQDVCVLGNPKMLVSSFTNGIVSGLGRAAYNNSGYGCSTIQTNAAINNGNSGGGLFDMYGNVMGIIDYKLVDTSGQSSVEGLGFAITINEAKPIINDLMTLGYVSNRPGLGITGEAISEYTGILNGINSGGVYVAYIDESKPVAKSGLRVGDIITAIDGTEIATIDDIQSIISKHNIGETVELTVYRKNEIGNYKPTKVVVELSELTLD